MHMNVDPDSRLRILPHSDIHPGEEQMLFADNPAQEASKIGDLDGMLS
jgi:hypothetical protein